LKEVGANLRAHTAKKVAAAEKGARAKAAKAKQATKAVGVKKRRNPHHGSTLDSFLREELRRSRRRRKTEDDLLARARKESRALVKAAGFTDADIDRLIKRAQREVEPEGIYNEKGPSTKTL